jgi:hypothetical protein
MTSAGGIPAFSKSFKFATCFVKTNFYGKKIRMWLREMKECQVMGYLRN